MEQARLLIAIVLSFLVLFLWEVFTVKQKNENAKEIKKEVVDIKDKEIKKAETIEQKSQKVIEDKKKDISISNPVISSQPKIITVTSSNYIAKISEKGALITNFMLKKYKENTAKDAPFKELVIPGDYKGTILTTFSKQELENESFVFESDTDTINVDKKNIEAIFILRSPLGIVIEKKYNFLPDSYIIGLSITIKNSSSNQFNDDLILSILSPFTEQNTSYGFEGPSALINNKIEQIKIKELDKKSLFNGKIKWIAHETHYFITSIIPKVEEETSMRIINSNKILQSQYLQPLNKIAPGYSKKYEYQLFFGPKSVQILKEANYDLSKAIDFGMFDFIAKPSLWLMNMLFHIIPNYGVVIIILTILIKMILWPLGSKSYKSMNEMKKLQPLMTQIREKYKNDKHKMNEELMMLYKTYKVNPFGGCIPIVIQLPVFFAFYQMLYGAIELRHAPFFGWINDLSAPDRLFNFPFSIPLMQPPCGIPVLTIIMGATMFLQQKMSPPPGDPSQATMMTLMPIVFTFIFINFPSGLVLYWLISNIISIIQQYYTTKKTA